MFNKSQYNQKISQLLNPTSFMVLFVITVITVYYLPPIYVKSYFILLLVLSWFSTNNSFWITFFVVLNAQPLRLFEETSSEALHRLPEYNIIGDYGLTFSELFLILYTLKAIFRGSHSRLALNNYYLLFMLYILFLLFISFVYGIDFSLVSYIRGLLYFTLFFSIPRLTKRGDYIFFYKIFSIFTILTIINQFSSAIFGFNLSDTISETEWVEFFFESRDMQRAYDSVLPQFFTYIIGFELLLNSRSPINKSYVSIMIFISFLSIFITGTRGWILAFTFTFIIFLGFYEKNKIQLLIKSSLFIIGIIILFYSISNLGSLLNSNIERVSTIKLLFTEDVIHDSSIESMGRITTRLPILLEGVKQEPIFGLGFSKYFTIYRDEHLGWANQVLQIGIIGIFIFVVFWTKFWIYNLRLSKSLNPKNTFKSSLGALNLGLFCLLVIHSTSRTMFNFSMHPMFLTLVILFFLLSDNIIKNAKHEEERLSLSSPLIRNAISKTNY